MRSPLPQTRYRAVSMELVAHLDDQRVDMLVMTDDGTTIVIECENDTIRSVQRHIAQIVRDCPEIGSWSPASQAMAEFQSQQMPSAFAP